MSAADDAILDELIIESKEHLENIEPNLLALEKEGGQVSPEIINTIFRAIHIIKGGFGFYGLKNIQGLSHAMESVLMQVRDGKMAVTPAMTDALLVGVEYPFTAFFYPEKNPCVRMRFRLCNTA